jgi:hypothetical protein
MLLPLCLRPCRLVLHKLLHSLLARIQTIIDLCLQARRFRQRFGDRPSADIANSGPQCPSIQARLEDV